MNSYTELLGLLREPVRREAPVLALGQVVGTSPLRVSLGGAVVSRRLYRAEGLTPAAGDTVLLGCTGHEYILLCRLEEEL